MSVELLNSDEIKRIFLMFEQLKKEQIERQKKFGKVKSIIQTNHKDMKFVAVGNKLHYSKKWKTFPDFLFEYVWREFGAEWYENENKKSIEEQNEIVKWFNKSLEFSSTQKPNDDGLFVANPNGSTAAYLLFSYDLFTVLNNNINVGYLIERLKDKLQFQGARYELFCLAACLRGGFKILLENEKDYSKKHVEFKIVDEESNTTFSVEAKSKHRFGVLGQPGKIVPDDELRVGNITQLINNAVSKDDNHPLIIFLEFNLQPEYADYIIGGKSWKKIFQIFDNVKKTSDGKDFFNLVVLTNHPHHYGKDDSPDPEKMYSLVYSLNPKHIITNKKSFDKVVNATLQYGIVPNNFDEL